MFSQFKICPKCRCSIAITNDAGKCPVCKANLMVVRDLEDADPNLELSSMEAYIVARKWKAEDQGDEELTTKDMAKELAYVYLTTWEVVCLAVGIVVSKALSKLGI